VPSTPAPPTLWNSLEVAKLVASVLTPAAVAFFGMWLNRYLKRIEHFQWANQKAVEKRLEVYSELAPLLNVTSTAILTISATGNGRIPKRQSL
jgi:adenylate kinase family enzyme